MLDKNEMFARHPIWPKHHGASMTDQKILNLFPHRQTTFLAQRNKKEKDCFLFFFLQCQMRTTNLSILIMMATMRVALSFAKQDYVARFGGNRRLLSSIGRGGATATGSTSPLSFDKLSAGASTPSVRLHSAARDSLAETSKTGEFVRRDSAWRNWVSAEEDAKFQPEAGRYHLIVAYACPWAHRTLMTRAIKGLDDVISVSVVHPIWQKTKPDVDSHRGWVFGQPDGPDWTNVDGRGGPFPSAFDGNEVDPLFGHTTVRDFYDYAGDTEGKYTVPILWDKKLNTIVSNESAEIIRMLGSAFNEFAKSPDVDLYPTELQEEIESVNEWIYPNINNGVYRCGFAKSQIAYDAAIEDLTNAFDKVDTILQKQRYIAGDTFTEADIRLFVTLLRFDEVYIVYFKTNTRSVTHTPAILNYCREIYQMPGVKETVNMEQIKTHYFCSHPELNYNSIIPKGSNFIKLLEEPHNRDSL